MSFKPCVFGIRGWSRQPLLTIELSHSEAANDDYISDVASKSVDDSSNQVKIFIRQTFIFHQMSSK